MACRQIQTGRPIAGNVNNEALCRKTSLDKIRNSLFVFNQKQAHVHGNLILCSLSVTEALVKIHSEMPFLSAFSLSIQAHFILQWYLPTIERRIPHMSLRPKSTLILIVIACCAFTVWAFAFKAQKSDAKNSSITVTGCLQKGDESDE